MKASKERVFTERALRVWLSGIMIDAGLCSKKEGVRIANEYFQDGELSGFIRDKVLSLKRENATLRSHVEQLEQEQQMNLIPGFRGFAKGSKPPASWSEDYRRQYLS